MKTKILIFVFALISFSGYSQNDPKITLTGTTGQATIYKGAVGANTAMVLPQGTHAAIYPDLPMKGRIQLNSQTNKLEVHNGTEWVELSLSKSLRDSLIYIATHFPDKADYSKVVQLYGKSTQTVEGILSASQGLATPNSVVAGAVSATNVYINQATPVNNYDATRKDYVDSGLSRKVDNSKLAQPLGVATLDGGGKIPSAQLPASMMTLQGNWNASTNTPTLANNVGTPGMIYVATTSGTVNFGAGNIAFNIGDFAIYGNDGKWFSSPNSNEVISVAGKKGVITLNKSDVGLSNVDNTSDTNKPVSTATQTALDAKQPNLISGTNIKNIEGQSLIGPGSIDLNKSDVGLSNVDNTSDTNKPVSIATQAALDTKQPNLVSGTNIKNIEGQSLIGPGSIDLNKSDVGLSNADNTSDLNKPVSTATQASLNNKADLVGGKVPLPQIPDSLIGAVNYQGTYDASANSPVLPLASNNKGKYWVVSVEGTQSSVLYKVGDWIISNGATWDKLDQSGKVSSVAGKTGAVSLTKADIGLANADNTSDINKPVSTATKNALDDKANTTGSNTSGTWPINISGSASRLVTTGGESSWNWADGNTVGVPPTWLWGSSDAANMYVYSPYSFPVSGATQSALDNKANTVSTLDIKNNIPDAADLNSYVNTGIYSQVSDAQAANGINYPILYAGILEVVKADYIYQTYQTYANINRKFFRGYYEGVWSGWKEVAAVAQTINNGVTNFAPSEDVVHDALATKANTDGSNAGGTWPINISGNATNSYTAENWTRTSISDFNAPIGYKLLEAGDTNILNAPPGLYGTGIQFSTASNPLYLSQLIFNLSGVPYTRSKIAGSWGGWSKIPFDQDILHTTGDETKSGNLTLTDGLQIGSGKNISWGGTYSAGYPTIAGSLAAGLRFYPNGSTDGEKMVIAPGGNVGIGTPTPGHKFNVSNNGHEGLEVAIPAYPDKRVVLQNYDRAESVFAPMHIEASSLTLNHSTGGYVGIGTDKPSYPLHVNGAAQFGSGSVNELTTRIVINNDWAKKWALSSGVPMVSQSMFGILNLTDNTAPFVIDSFSKTGVGTVSPIGKLHVAGGDSMTSGYNRTTVLQDTYPFLALNSTVGLNRYAGISYDSGAGLGFWVNGAGDDITATASQTLLLRNNGTAEFTGEVSVPNASAGTSAINKSQLEASTIKVDNSGIANGADTRKNNYAWFDYNITNVDNGFAGSTMTFGGLNGNYPVQIGAPYNNSDNFFFRSHNGDTNRWNPWRAVWHDGNFNPAAKANTNGSNASGTWPIDITGRAVYSNNTVNWSTTAVTDFNVPTGFKLLESYGASSINSPSGTWTQGIQFSTNNNPDYINQLVFDSYGKLYSRTKHARSWGGWNSIPFDSSVVHLFNDEGIGGIKHFYDGIKVPKGLGAEYAVNLEQMEEVCIRRYDYAINTTYNSSADYDKLNDDYRDVPIRFKVYCRNNNTVAEKIDKDLWVVTSVVGYITGRK